MRDSELHFLKGELTLNYTGTVDNLAELFKSTCPNAKLDLLCVHGGLRYDEVEVVSADTCFSVFSNLKFVHKKVKGARNIQDPRLDTKYASLS